MDNYFKVAKKVSIISIIGNLFLSLIKLLAGFIGHSTAMISDAIHSASDVFSTIIVIIGIKVSEKEPDEEHPYGHERLECVASVLLAMSLAVIGGGIGWKAITSIISKSYLENQMPGMIALIAAVASIVSKELMYQYTKYHGKKINSTALMADAWHHRSDAISSVGALIGIVVARLGYPIFDPLASIAICIFIFKAAWDIFMDAINKMIDTACDEETVNGLLECAMKVEGVKGVDEIKTRAFGARAYVDIEISVDGNMTLNEAHKIAEAVHDKIEECFPQVKHCMVHENPAE